MSSVKTKKTASEPVIVAIGASAGGLEALQEFFKAVPLDTGLAFVVIQHLSPDYKSLMDELLARQTKLRICVINDAMPVESNTVYLIPPRQDLVLFHNQLVLREQGHTRGVHLPVDVFFSSLAQEKGRAAIGVILSGTGSDGTLGTRAIKEAGGIVMAQDESTAKFNGMPRSAIATGLIDYILPPSQMPEALVQYVQHPFVKKASRLEAALTRNSNPLTQAILILRDFSGVDFSLYKETTLIRRLERRVSINHFDSLETYLAYLKESEKEKQTLFREMFIGVTRFFRDQEAFVSLEKNVFPELLQKKSLRIWSAGCSTGEEVYSLAILLLQTMEQQKRTVDIKIFATDIDRHALDIASRGFYSDSIAADVPPAMLLRWFDKTQDGYLISDAVRKLVVFASHNLLKDPPFSKIDLLVCRNLFIYFKPEVQNRLFGSIYHSLSPQGVLFLGTSESLGPLADGFVVVDSKNKIFRRQPGFTVPLEITPLYREPRDQNLPNSVLKNHENGKAERLLSQTLSAVLPPSVLIDANDQILQTFNDTSAFLKIPEGKFSSSLFDLLPPDLKLLASSLLRQLKTGTPYVSMQNIDGYRVADETTSFLLSFRESPTPLHQAPSPEHLDQLVLGRVSDLEKELQFTRESLQATVEELETSNEELQSSNEELIASNEELQSTNEELQSVNEELYTVNSEYQNKIEELTNLNNDEANLLRNTGVGALYLDSNLNIRKLTPKVSVLTRIMPADLGRPLEHLSPLPSYPALIEDIRTTLNTLQSIDRAVTGIDGRQYLASIRPYRTDYNAIDGIIITFNDITSLQTERREAAVNLQRLNQALELGRMGWWEWDVSTGLVLIDPRKATMLGYTPETFPNKVEEICALLHPEDYESVMKAMRDHLTGQTPLWDMTYRIRRSQGGWAVYHDRGAVAERDAQGKPLKVIGMVMMLQEVVV